MFMYFKSCCMWLSDLVRLLFSGEVCEYLIWLALQDTWLGQKSHSRFASLNDPWSWNLESRLSPDHLRPRERLKTVRANPQASNEGSNRNSGPLFPSVQYFQDPLYV